MAAGVPFTSLVESLPATIPFVGPETIERRRGATFRARIGANESAFGVSPRAREAMAAAVDNLGWYGDPEGFELRERLAALHGVTRDEVCLGAGIDELLGVIVRMVAAPGAPVVTSLGAYPTFNYHVAGFGAELHAVPFRDDREDLDALADKVLALDAPLVYLSNPDNPMGTWHPASALEAFIARLPETTAVVLDEAYSQFAPTDAVLPQSAQPANVFRMRTFSKAYGMAGARIGYTVTSAHNVGGLNRIRNHFGVNRVAQAGAMASLDDDAFAQHVLEETAAGREEYYALAERLGLTAIRSATNFVAVDVGGGDIARALLADLEAEGVFIRMPGVAPLDRCIRVTVGTPAERAVFAEVFERVLAARR